MTNPNRWLKSQIETVGAGALNFPQHEVTHWMAMRTVPKALQAVLVETDAAMAEIEDSRELTPDGIATRSKAAARAAITALESRSKISEARSQGERRKQGLTAKKMPKEAKSAEEIALAAEIRSHLSRTEKAGRLVAASNMVRQSALAADAILGAPGFLTGLSEAELTLLRSALPADTSPEGVEVAEIDRCLKVLDSALLSATSMIASRAGLTRGQNGSFA